MKVEQTGVRITEMLAILANGICCVHHLDLSDG